MRLLVREGWWRPEHMTARCLREGRDIVGEVAFIMTDQWKNRRWPLVGSSGKNDIIKKLKNALQLEDNFLSLFLKALN